MSEIKFCKDCKFHSYRPFSFEWTPFPWGDMCHRSRGVDMVTGEDLNFPTPASLQRESEKNAVRKLNTLSRRRKWMNNHFFFEVGIHFDNVEMFYRVECFTRLQDFIKIIEKDGNEQFFAMERGLDFEEFIERFNEDRKSLGKPPLEQNKETYPGLIVYINN